MTPLQINKYETDTNIRSKTFWSIKMKIPKHIQKKELNM